MPLINEGFSAFLISPVCAGVLIYSWCRMQNERIKPSLWFMIDPLSRTPRLVRASLRSARTLLSGKNLPFPDTQSLWWIMFISAADFVHFYNWGIIKIFFHFSCFLFSLHSTSFSNQQGENYSQRSEKLVVWGKFFWLRKGCQALGEL